MKWVVNIRVWANGIWRAVLGKSGLDIKHHNNTDVAFIDENGEIRYKKFNN